MCQDVLSDRYGVHETYFSYFKFSVKGQFFLPPNFQFAADQYFCLRN